MIVVSWLAYGFVPLSIIAVLFPLHVELGLTALLVIVISGSLGLLVLASHFSKGGFRMT